MTSRWDGTPTTTYDVREAFLRSEGRHEGEDEQFDAWLAAEKSKAWNLGYTAGMIRAQEDRFLEHGEDRGDPYRPNMHLGSEEQS